MTKITYLQALIDSSMPAEDKKNAMRPPKELQGLANLFVNFANKFAILTGL